MSEPKRFGSVTDMASDLFGDEKLANDLRQRIEENGLAKVLFRVRCKRRLTQAQVAAAMDKTQGAVSKFEHSTNDKISVQQLVDYTRAVGLRLVIQFERPMNKVQRVKYLFAQICEQLEELRELAGDDEDIRKGVSTLHDEWLGNTLIMFLEAKAELGELPERDRDSGVETALTVIPPDDPSDELLFRFAKRLKEEGDVPQEA